MDPRYSLDISIYVESVFAEKKSPIMKIWDFFEMNSIDKGTRLGLFIGLSGKTGLPIKKILEQLPRSAWYRSTGSQDFDQSHFQRHFAFEGFDWFCYRRLDKAEIQKRQIILKAWILHRDDSYKVIGGSSVVMQVHCFEKVPIVAI